MDAHTVQQKENMKVPKEPEHSHPGTGLRRTFLDELGFPCRPRSGHRATAQAKWAFFWGEGGFWNAIYLQFPMGKCFSWLLLKKKNIFFF